MNPWFITSHYLLQQFGSIFFIMREENLCRHNSLCSHFWDQLTWNPTCSNLCISSSFNAHSTVPHPTSCVMHTISRCKLVTVKWRSPLRRTRAHRFVLSILQRGRLSHFSSCVLVLPSLNIFCHYWTLLKFIMCSSLCIAHNLLWISAQIYFQPSET